MTVLDLNSRLATRARTRSRLDHAYRQSEGLDFQSTETSLSASDLSALYRTIGLWLWVALIAFGVAVTVIWVRAVG